MGIVFLTAVRAVVIANPAILGILPSMSLILLSQSQFFNLFTGINRINVFNQFIMFSFFTTLLTLITLLSLLKSVGTGPI